MFVICTLFEGHYHFGVAALINSLVKQGFQGTFYAGYRGELPSWTSEADEDMSVPWAGARKLRLSPGVEVYLLPITTEFHLTNYKPFFMLQLWKGLAENASGMAYFDPDIVVKCKWKFFENWMTHGIALVHEISSNDMPPTHPIRKEWEKVIIKAGLKVERRIHSYINGGFCGVLKENIEFLHVWALVTNTGIKHFRLTPNQWDHSYDRSYIFYAQDQDALNIAAMSCSVPVSEMGPEAMDFTPGGFTMSHALGSPKPWKKNYLSQIIQGRMPSTADRSFWSNVNEPISVFGLVHARRKAIVIKVAAFIGRFYHI